MSAGVLDAPEVLLDLLLRDPQRGLVITHLDHRVVGVTTPTGPGLDPRGTGDELQVRLPGFLSFLAISLGPRGTGVGDP